SEFFENLLITKGAFAYMLIIPGINNAVIKYFPIEDGGIPKYENILFTPKSMVKIPSILLSGEMGDSLLMKDGQTIKTLQSDFFKSRGNKFFYSKSTVSLNFSPYTEEVKAPNVIGVINGTDKNADCVIVSAHHDHEGKQGKKIYYGAVDNASGTTAIIEMAALMNKCIKAGYRPKRTIIFASFTGEERGLLGSMYYSEHPLYPISKTYAVLNIDMMGRVDTFYSGKRADSNYAYILVKDSLNRGLRKAVYDANESGAVHLKLDTYYEQPEHAQRRITGSDQYPFYLKGVPFIRIDCGFAKDYHKPTDTPDKINYDLLKKQTQLAFLTLWNITNN
ncbi:MAG: M28 family peptidase, partial [Ginsengibacter sp.]